jgi:ribose transport system ATP-binding protein
MSTHAISASAVPLWEMVNVTKQFAGFVANKCVCLKLNAGEIHGLMGENGSGKSTLIKTLSGAHLPDSGQLLRSGKAVQLNSPITAREHGVATVFQEFSLVGSLSVAENIHLGRLKTHRRILDWKTMRSQAKQVIESMEIDIDVDAEVASLSVAEQQLVEIAKALVADASLIILDEPTTALSDKEIHQLHALLRRLKDEKRAILYISHRLDEVVALVDVITILKDGEVASDANTTRIDIEHIVKTMVGDAGEHYPKQVNAKPEVLLDVKNLCSDNRVKHVSFQLHKGEVFGLGGVLGSGRTEIARALFGLDALTSGGIHLGGSKLNIRNPRDAIQAGLALVPENRKTDGLFLNFTGVENITAAALHKLGRWGSINLQREREHGRVLMQELEINPAAEHRYVGQLSGGNQQKVVIARWRFSDAEVFIMDEPTQGIDIGAKIAVYRFINSVTKAGKGVILISSDYDELVSMCDRIGTIRQGCLTNIQTTQQIRQSAQRGVWAAEETSIAKEITPS